MIYIWTCTFCILFVLFFHPILLSSVLSYFGLIKVFSFVFKDFFVLSFSYVLVRKLYILFLFYVVSLEFYHAYFNQLCPPGAHIMHTLNKGQVYDYLSIPKTLQRSSTKPSHFHLTSPIILQCFISVFVISHKSIKYFCFLNKYYLYFINTFPLLLSLHIFQILIVISFSFSVIIAFSLEVIKDAMVVNLAYVCLEIIVFFF